MKNKSLKNFKSIITEILAVLFWIAVWHTAAVLAGKELLLPKPTSVFIRLSCLFLERSFYSAVINSIIRIMSGFIFGVLGGIVLAVFSNFAFTANNLITPMIVIIKTTPVASFIILALVWIDTTSIPTFISFLMVLPIVYANILQGMKNISKELKEVTAVFGFSFGKKIKYLYLPSLAPYFISAFCTSLGLAWKAGIAAEVLARPKNTIGTRLYDSKIYLETVDLFAYTVLIILLSLVIEKLLVYLIKRLMNKYLIGGKEIGKHNLS